MSDKLPSSALPPSPAWACRADVDEQGRPRPTPAGFPEPAPERFRELEARRQQMLAEGGPTPTLATPSVPPGREGTWELKKKPALAVPMESHMTQEEFDELGYPTIPKEWTAEWMLEQIEKEKVDPRENPNLLLDETHQDFWDNLSRKPYAKAILRSEQHWVDRKKVWLKQYERIEVMNQCREFLGEQLEECSPELKRLVTPILHHRICETSLWNSFREAQERDVPFPAVVERPEKLRELQGMRSAIDLGGAAAAARLMREFDARAERIMGDRHKEQEEASRRQRVVTDTDNASKRLNLAQKLKKDGYLEWQKGNVEEALFSWREADGHLKRYKLPPEHLQGNRMIADMHSAILKNVAQAAIRLGYWTEALEAADAALVLNDQDYKAWFRRACALEGLGRYEEEEEALRSIDDLAVGRPDRDRIQKELGARRGKLRAAHDRDLQVQKRSIVRAVARGVFQDSRALADVPDDCVRLDCPPTIAALAGSADASFPALQRKAQAAPPLLLGCRGIRATSSTGRPVHVLDHMAIAGDRIYADCLEETFADLGSFEGADMSCIRLPRADAAQEGEVDAVWTLELAAPATVYVDLHACAGGVCPPPPTLAGDDAEWLRTEMSGTLLQSGCSERGVVYKRDFAVGSVSFTARSDLCIFAETDVPPFREGDPVVVREVFADLQRGQRGAVVELDADGDARLRFEGAEDDELIFKMDFRHIARDPAAASGDPEEQPPAGCPAEGRRRLNREAAAELLGDLTRAYEDSSFQQRVAKLARDMRWSREDFLARMRIVAAEVLHPIARRWGFEGSARGITQLQLALQDHSWGPEADEDLEAQAAEASRLLYGEMHPVLFRGAGESLAPEMIFGVG